MPPLVDTLVLKSSVTPRWIRNGDRFWYRNTLARSLEYMYVDPERRVRRRAFDHARLAAALNAALPQRDPLRGDSLPIDSLGFSATLDSVDVIMRASAARCSLLTYACASIPLDTLARQAGRSPDGKWIAFVRDFNLWVRSTATGEERQLTTDGIRENAYGMPVPSVARMVQQGSEVTREDARVVWSPDSKRFATYRTDIHGVPRLTMTQFAPSTGTRPRFYSYVYPLVGDSVLPKAAPIIFEVDGWRRIDARMEPVEHTFYAGGPGLRWTTDGTRVRFAMQNRDYSGYPLYDIDARTGAARVLFEERDSLFVDVYGSVSWTPVPGSHDVLWASPRDGWNHLYLVDGSSGAIRRQLTRGEWVLDFVAAVDTTRKRVFFAAFGREPNRDPYFVHLYRVDLDGRGLRLLTPEAGTHSAAFSPSRDYFVDTYSRVDLPPVSVLRRASDGAVILELEGADASRLYATGWKAPEPFTALARDGRTPIYGLIWKPTNFDSTKRYPIVEQVYTGPHSFFVPKTFAAYRSQAQAIAELGFITIMVDGLGTAGRSRAFHVHSYKSLGAGTADHPGAIRQAASTRPYMDTSRVGIFGHSAGAYDAAHAMLVFPDFYKVGVASAGDHDARLDKAVWNAQWMGYDVGPHYAAQANATLASRLRGKLLIAHGDIDDNVPLANTMQFADALIRADVDFDMLIMPGQAHGLGGNRYFMRRRWDYFVKHLLGVEPPRFTIGGVRALQAGNPR